MKRFTVLMASALFASVTISSPAIAGWKLVDARTPVAVAKGKLTVTPAEDWNRWSTRPIKKSEVWTLDGVTLNELYFVSGLAPGETLYRDVAKKDRPLPKLGSSMLLTDIPEFYESSNRTGLGTSLFELSTVEPIKFGGHDGVRFTFTYSVQGSALPRKGVAVGTLVDGQLYLISYVAPSILYYDRDVAKVEAIIASAKI